MSSKLRPTAVLLALSASAAAPAAAQDDIVQLGRIHGTQPPAAYFEQIARDPGAFRFSRAWMARNPRLRLIERPEGPPRVELRERPAGAASLDAAGAPAGVLGRRDGPVAGTFRFPLLLGYYKDMSGPPPFATATVQAEFFDGPSSRVGTVTELYDELSGGLVDLRGATFAWAQSSLTGQQVTGGVSGLGYPGRVGEFILDLLAAADDGTVDWGLFDNDGPDGVPNSGDDDGWVDLLAVFQPTNGAECNGSGSKVWSHKWSLSSWGTGSFTTSTPSANGGFVRVDDYTIQPVYNCSGMAINEIGVFAHELGHGFGLPDLYCTAQSCSHEGIGRWGLMGSGAWGCSSAASDGPARPCHMSAWSKTVLGWADVVDLAPDADLGTMVFDPVETTGRVYRWEVPGGSGEHFLVENRQRLGFDAALMAPGLLVWHVDPQEIDARWEQNRVNNDRFHYGVWLRQADGRNQLESVGSDGNRGDGGDPFPGSTNARAFHAGTSPAAYTHGGDASGLTLLDVTDLGGGAVSARVLTRFQNIAVRTEGETSGGLLTIDGAVLAGSAATFPSAPFETHAIEASSGEPLGEGRRRAFERWVDDDAAPRVRTIVTPLADAEYVARYGPLEVHLDVALEGGAFDVAPGRIVTSPASEDLWFAEGTSVTVTAEPTPGFDFVGWEGGLAGASNPFPVTMDAPVAGVARFELDYALPAEVPITLEAAAAPDLELVAPEGTAPFAWDLVGGTLPEGLSLDHDGRFAGAALEVGIFPLDVRVRDALGLEATGRVRLDVAAPDIPLGTLAAPLLGVGTHPTAIQLIFLDQGGNGNGAYDVGDLRIFLRAHPDLAAAVAASSGQVLLPMTPMVPSTPAQRRAGGRR